MPEKFDFYSHLLNSSPLVDKMHVLVVDPQAEELTRLEWELWANGIVRISSFTTAKEALTFLSDARINEGGCPEVAILGVNVPMKSGAELLSWCRNNPKPHLKKIPFLLMSEQIQASPGKEVFEKGSVAIVPKQFEFAGIFGVVKELSRMDAVMG